MPLTKLDRRDIDQFSKRLKQLIKPPANIEVADLLRYIRSLRTVIS